MQTVLEWAGILVGFVGVLYASAVVLASREGSAPTSLSRLCPFRDRFRPLGIAIAASILLPFLLSLNRQPPFAPGGHLGWGFLLGGIFAAALAWLIPVVQRLLPADLPLPRQWLTGTGLSLGLSSWTLIGANLTLLLFKAQPTDALMGYALAFVVVTILARGAGDSALRAPGEAPLWEGLGQQALLAAGLVAAACLAVYHFPLQQESLWWSLPFALVAWGVLAAIIGSRFASFRGLGGYGTRLFIGASVAAVLVAAVALLLATNTLPSLPMFLCVSTGLVAAGLVVWLIAGATDPEEAATTFQTTAFVALVIVGLVAACFRALAGYGVALAFCASWAVLLPALGGLAGPRGEQQARWRAWGTGIIPFLGGWLIVPFYRLFVERYEAKAFEATVHYSFIGMAVGVLVVLLFAGYGLRTLRPRAGSARSGACFTLIRTGLLGLVALAVPLLFVVLWGERAGASLIAGLAVGTLILAVWQSSGRTGGELAPAATLFGLGSALGAVQFTHLLQPLLVASRTTKLMVVLGVAIVALLWMIIDAALAYGRSGEARD